MIILSFSNYCKIKLYSNHRIFYFFILFFINFLSGKFHIIKKAIIILLEIIKMYGPLQRTLIETLQNNLNFKYESDQNPTSDTIVMIIGLVFIVGFLLIFFIFIAYFLAWWNCYDLFCYKWTEHCCFNCLKCYFFCPCMENRGYQQSKLNQSSSNGKMFVQDLLAAPDGSIIHLSDIRPVSNNCQSSSNTLESGLI